MRSASRTDWKARELDDKLRAKRRDAAKRGRAVLQAAMEPARADATGGWVEVSHGDGDVYYHNEVTGVTSWDRPAERGGPIDAVVAAAPAAAPATTESAALAEGWEVATSPEGGLYYFNMTTQQTSWDHPGYAVAAGNAGGDLFRSMLTAPAPAAATADPYVWVKTEDPNSGVPYWYRTATGETTWNDPNVERAESGAAGGGTYAAAPSAVERPPVREGAIALVEMSAQQVQYLLRFHRLVALLPSFTEAGVDGAMLNDMTTIEDLDEIVQKLRVRKKKLLRVLAAARSEGVALEDLDGGQPAPAAAAAAAAAEEEEEEEVTAVTELADVDAALVVRMQEPPPQGPCLIGGLACNRHNAVVSKPGTLGLELCTVLILKSKRILVEVKNVTPGSVMAAFDVKTDDWLEVIDGVNVDLMGGLDVNADGRISLEELDHIRARIEELGRAAGRRGPPRQHLPSAAYLMKMYDTDRDGTLDLTELYDLIDGPLMSRIVGLLGVRPLTLSFVRRTVALE